MKISTSEYRRLVECKVRVEAIVSYIRSMDKDRSYIDRDVIEAFCGKMVLTEEQKEREFFDYMDEHMKELDEEDDDVMREEDVVEEEDK